MDELGVPEVGAVGEERASSRLGAREAELLKESCREIDAPAGDAIEHRPDGGVVGGREQCEFDPVACGQFGDSLEEEAKLLEWSFLGC